MKKTLVLLLVLGVVAGGSAFGSASSKNPDRARPTTNWLQYRGRQQRAGYNAAESGITTSSVMALKAIAGFKFDRIAPPVIYNGTLYTIVKSFDDPGKEREQSTIYAVNALTGKIKWEVLVNCRIPDGAPAISVASGVLIVPTLRACGSETGSGSLIGLDLQTRARLWEGSDHSNGTPAVVGDTAYVPMDDGSRRLAAIDVSTGNEIWSIEAALGTPAVGGGILYAHEGSDTLSAFDAHTGARLWSRGSVIGDPTVSAGRVYAECDEGICSFSRAGVPKWSADGFGQISIVEGKLYAGCDADKVCVLDAKTGAPGWSAPISGTYASSTVAGGVVYVELAEDGSRVHPMDAATGEPFELFGETTQPEFYRPTYGPVVANGRVYLISENRIYIYGPE